MANYTVSYWGSHPDAENDDCWTGLDFDTLEAALAQFQSNESPMTPPADPAFMVLSCAYIEIDGPDVHGVRANPIYNSKAAQRQREQDAAIERSERLWQRRMLSGTADE